MSDGGDKPIVISLHAKTRMVQRGATFEEVTKVLREGQKEQAKRGKWHSILKFEFDKPSPITGLTYTHKTVDIVFLEEPERIVVLTVKVYYHN